MTTTAAVQTATESFRAKQLSTEDRASALQTLADELPDDKKKELARTLLFGEEPSPKIRDTLYLLVIGVLLVILLACAAVLTGIISPSNGQVTMDRVLGIFTTVLSFIIGLFVPSPATQS
jgi:hypothetical protein